MVVVGPMSLRCRVGIRHSEFGLRGWKQKRCLWRLLVKLSRGKNMAEYQMTLMDRQIIARDTLALCLTQMELITNSEPGNTLTLVSMDLSKGDEGAKSRVRMSNHNDLNYRRTTLSEVFVC